MNKLISWLQNIRLRQIITVFLVGITVFVIQAFGSTNVLQAQAETVTPEASSYQVDRTATKAVKSDNGLVEKIKETAETVREKLNLDEPIDPGTKDFLNSTEERIEEVVKPVTGKEKGYYLENK